MTYLRLKIQAKLCSCIMLTCILVLSACGESNNVDNTYRIQYNAKVTNDIFAPSFTERLEGENYDVLEFTLDPDSSEAEFALRGDEVLTGTLSGPIIPVMSEAGNGYGCVLKGQVNDEETSYRVIADIICSDSDAFAILTMRRTNKTELMCVYGELNNTIEAINEAYREYLSEPE